jgi:N6-L-threonylcarbamoyladenine synthase
VILGIETSCDETAAALVSADGVIRSSVVSSQADLHARYGGVVPEVASRRHLELVTPVIEDALAEARAWATSSSWPRRRAPASSAPSSSG